MKNIILYLTLFFFFFPLPLSAIPLSLNEIGQATCRVDSGGGLGSGTCVHEDEKNIYVLTNAHVVSRSNKVSLEFFRAGLKTNKIPADVIWRRKVASSDVDFAILKVSKSYFGKYPPRIIPLASPSHKIKQGDYIAAGGCPNGRWLQLWEGQATSNNNSRVIFTPPPVSGQSGSGVIIVVKGSSGEYFSRVGAILTWRLGGLSNVWDSNGNNIAAKGGAIPISTLHASLNNKVGFTPTLVPLSYRHIKKEQYGLGSDGRCYEITINSKGNRTCFVPLGVKIVQWNCPPGT